MVRFQGFYRSGLHVWWSMNTRKSQPCTWMHVFFWLVRRSCFQQYEDNAQDLHGKTLRCWELWKQAWMRWTEMRSQWCPGCVGIAIQHWFRHVWTVLSAETRSVQSKYSWQMREQSDNQSDPRCKNLIEALVEDPHTVVWSGSAPVTKPQIPWEYTNANVSWTTGRRM